MLSSLAIHNIKQDRQKAVQEADRVCKPKGRILIVDIEKAGEYAAQLRDRGYAVVPRPAGWRMWFGGPWVSAAVVEARKP